MCPHVRYVGFRTVAIVLAMSLLGAGNRAVSAVQPIVVERVDLPAKLGRSLPENTLKLFRAAVDPDARRLFVAGILTPYLAVMDLDSGRWIASIDSALPRGYKYLYSDPLNHQLFIRDGSNGSLSRVDPQEGTVGARVDVPSHSGGVLCDGERGLVYFTTPEPPSLRAFREDTLELAWTTDAMGNGISSLDFDPERRELLLLDGSRTGPEEGRIYRFDPDRRMVIGTLTFDLPPGSRAGNLRTDPVRNRLVVTVGNREIRILGMDGTLFGTVHVPGDLELQSVALDTERSRLLAVADERPEENEAAGVGGHVLVVSLETGEIEADIAFGRKLHSLAIDAATGIAYLPNGDAGTVWRVDPERGTVTGFRLGDSAEQLLPVDGGRRLIINSRLGGSYLMAWDAPSHEVETFSTGTWPIPIRSIRDRNLLLVLNAWDGTISVLHDTDLQNPVATIALDLPPGTTDRLPDLEVDPGRGLAFAAYPEYAAIALADLSRDRPDGVLHVPGAVPGDTGGGPGQLLLGVDSGQDRLLAVEPARGRVTVFSIDDRTVLATAGFRADRTGPLTTDMLFADAAHHTCWVGRVELDFLDGTPTGRELPRGDRIFAVDEDRGVYWAAGVEATDAGPRDVLVALERETLEVAGAWDLGTADAVHSSFAFVPPGRIWRVRMTTVDLFAYDLVRAARQPTGRASGVRILSIGAAPGTDGLPSGAS